MFPEEQDVLAEDRVADDAAIVEAPVQSIHNAPVVAAPVGGSLSSAGGGLGTIAPKEPPAPAAAPASAIPPHIQNTISEPTSGINTGDNTPTDSIANTPAATATEPAASLEQPSPQPQGQPQVESQLHDQPLPAEVPNDAQLQHLAARAEAEQPADQDDTLLTADLAASVPATTFEDDTPGAGAGAADVEMKDA